MKEKQFSIAAIEPVAVSIQQAAELLGVSERAVYALSNIEGFPIMKIGEGRKLVVLSGLKRWADEQIGKEVRYLEREEV